MTRLTLIIIGAIAGFVLLAALGIWQMQRLDWKQNVLGELEAAMTADPVALPAMPQAEAHRYLPVAAEGVFTGDELHVLASVKGEGAVYRVIAPFQTTDGRLVMVDRGTIPTDQKDTVREPSAARVIGNLHWPDEVDEFTPDPQREENIWFARDVPLMAAVLGTEPVLLVAREIGGLEATTTPHPIDTSGIPNDHLQYAITWFALALIWAGMTVTLVHRISRPRRRRF
ncbi:MAG: SURF1 family protein [Rhodobacteraceae bacterium]|nr:SURF1 family protein [Paracoccaceae bacterium]